MELSTNTTVSPELIEMEAGEKLNPEADMVHLVQKPEILKVNKKIQNKIFVFILAKLKLVCKNRDYVHAVLDKRLV